MLILDYSFTNVVESLCESKNNHFRNRLFVAEKETLYLKIHLIITALLSFQDQILFHLQSSYHRLQNVFSALLRISFQVNLNLIRVWSFWFQCFQYITFFMYLHFNRKQLYHPCFMQFVWTFEVFQMFHFQNLKINNWLTRLLLR